MVSFWAENRRWVLAAFMHRIPSHVLRPLKLVTAAGIWQLRCRSWQGTEILVNFGNYWQLHATLALSVDAGMVDETLAQGLKA